MNQKIQVNFQKFKGRLPKKTRRHPGVGKKRKVCITREQTTIQNGTLGKKDISIWQKQDISKVQRHSCIRLCCRANCPEINVTEGVSKRESSYRPQGHCPLNSVIEDARLKSLESQGGDQVTAASKWEYVRVMSGCYQEACRTVKHIILPELEKDLNIHRKSAIRALLSGN